MAKMPDIKPLPPSRVSRYRNLHLWMLLPFAITALGFAPRYVLALTTRNGSLPRSSLSSLRP